MALASQIPGEEYYRIAIGQGMYTADLPTNIPDGYSPICYNLIATGDSVENRIGMKIPSVNWRVNELAPTGASGDYNVFCQIDPWSRDSSKPAFMWGARGYSVPGSTLLSPTLNFIRAAGVTGSGDGFISKTVGAEVIGICQYGGDIYYSSEANGVARITSIDWAADDFNLVSIPSTAGATLKGLFTFKDRLWAWGSGSGSHKLYYTDLPSTPGGRPETWALATNVIPFVGPLGRGAIKCVVPLGNKLAVFTTNGFYTLLVEGAPASWIMRVLDSRSICTTNQCAFESKGIIYYINTQGVWATNNLTSTKLSAVIEDQWFLATGFRAHSIVHYEDGMIVSIFKINPESRYFDRENCRVFYSKLDPIGWTEWGINKHGLGTSNQRLCGIYTTTSKIPTYLSSDPTVYMLAFFTDSTAALDQYACLNLLIFSGGVDTFVNRTNVAETLPVGIYLKTKLLDGGNPYNVKRAKRGMLEIYTSDVDHEFQTSWDLDATYSEASEVRVVQHDIHTVGVGSNLIQVLNQLYFRRCAFNLRAYLQTNTSQIKIKDLAIAQDTGRSEFEGSR